VTRLSIPFLLLSIACVANCAATKNAYAIQEIAFEKKTSFEEARTGGFTELKTEIGQWTNIEGRVLVNDEHAKSGTRSLQIAGGESSSVELVLAEPNQPNSQLSFWAERWTSRTPFSFRIEKPSTEQGTWTEIYNGDKQIKVGRSFRSQVKIPLGAEPISRLRFSVSSPRNTGLLIDDLKISPARPMKVTDVEVVPLALPALVGTDASAIAKLKITTTGSLDPISLSKITARLIGESTRQNVNHLQCYSGENQSSFHSQTPIGIRQKPWQGIHEFETEHPLIEGDNFVWLACKLKADSDLDELIGANFEEVTFSNGESIKLSSKPSVQRIGVALRKAGEDGVHTYRIPGLATTNKGTLIGVYDVRRDQGSDLPGNIDVGMSRSIDGGRNWEPMKIIMNMGDDPKWNGDGVGDPSVLVDRESGTIWVSGTWSHGNRSWHGSGPGLLPEETGQWMMTKSEDDGVTWSTPINITNQVKRPEWSFLLQGPGKGITMSDGTLVFPAQYQDAPNPSDKTNHRLPHSTFIYSRDQGKTWQIATGAWDDTTESQVIELKDGELMLNCRFNRKSSRVIVTTRDRGRTWQTHSTHVKDLIEPRACMASLINVGRELGWRNISNDFNNEFLLFSNPNSLNGRNHTTIKASKDSGETWPAETQLLLDEQTGAGYSCMSMIDSETVGILYEGSQAQMTFQRIKIKDILNPPKKFKNSNPTLSISDQ
jgi:sialidase-1